MVIVTGGVGRPIEDSPGAASGGKSTGSFAVGAVVVVVDSGVVIGVDIGVSIGGKTGSVDVGVMLGVTEGSIIVVVVVVVGAVCIGVSFGVISSGVLDSPGIPVTGVNPESSG